MAKSGKTLRDLFHDTLKDIYFAEKKIQNRREGLLLPDDTLTDLQKVAEEYGLQKLLPFWGRENRSPQCLTDRIYLSLRSKTRASTAFLGVPGEENLDVNESLRNSSIKPILTRHEQGAGLWPRRTAGWPESPAFG
jgi:hypothetical protein